MSDKLCLDDFDDIYPVEHLPVLALRGLVVFPGNVFHFDVGRKKSIAAINAAIKGPRRVFLTPQTDLSIDEPSEKDLCPVGTVAELRQVLKQSDDEVRVLVEGQYRARMIDFLDEKKYFKAKVQRCDFEVQNKTIKTAALMRQVKLSFYEYAEIAPKIGKDIISAVRSETDPSKLADLVATNTMFEYEDKQDIICTLDYEDRLEKILYLLIKEVDILALENELVYRAKSSIDKNQKEYFLREQMKVISEELGDDDNPQEEADEYRYKILKLRLGKESEEKLMKECDKLYRMPGGSHEASVIRNYLDTCLDLPWNKKAKIKINLPKTQKILDKDHYGLDKVKERIIELLAVRKMAPEMKGQIICLVGPPGVGKTSIAKSIARAIGTKYIRIALGGVKDEAEIRGHRRTYIGAMPGRIISSIKSAGVNNPLMLFDEIDKLGNDFRGDPTSAMLEVLDAEQNNTFEDHYIDLPFDLSDVLFVTTANDYSAIPDPLRDRMEVIELSSYTYEEKFNIAKKHLIPKQLKRHALTMKQLKISDTAIKAVIEGYTKEAGVRNLERKLTAIMRKCVKGLVNDPDQKKVVVTDKNIEDFLGTRKYRSEELSKRDEIGLVNGLAWTSVGGEVMPIEVAVSDGTGKLVLTGSLGDVMKESAKTALTCIRTRAEGLGIAPDFYSKTDIHVHAPEGAIPKDGPSAGTAMATAIASALSGTPINHEVAMTGEITLRGRVLTIGGLKEKSIAAYRNGIKTVLIPKSNLSDLEEIDSKVRDSLEFIPVEKFDDVIKYALVPQMRGLKRKSGTKKGKKIDTLANNIPKRKKSPVAVQ